MKRMKKTQKKLDADTNQKQNQIILTNKKSNHEKASFAALLALKNSVKSNIVLRLGHKRKCPNNTTKWDSYPYLKGEHVGAIGIVLSLP